MHRSAKRSTETVQWARVPFWWWHSLIYHIALQKAPKWLGKVTRSGHYYTHYKNGDKSYLLDNEYGIIFEHAKVA